MIRFYAPDIEKNGVLPESESGHVTRVLRKQAGDHIFVVDGKGYCYECEIKRPHPKATEVEIINKTREANTWNGKITLAIAPTKNIDRIEWFIEKAVEMGIDRIVLLKCSHSERKNVNLERLEKIMVSAMKQSLKAKLPELEGLVDFNSFVEGNDSNSRFIGYCDKDTDRRVFVKEYHPSSDVTVVIGPEGDFSPEEIESARRFDFLPVTFGDSRLRTETAALFAVAAIHAINQLNS